LLVLRSRSWRKGLKPVFIAVVMLGALSGAAAVGVAQTGQDPADPPSSLLGKGNDFTAAELWQSLEMAANDLGFWLRVTSGDLSECTSPTCGVVDVKFNIERIVEYCGNIPRAARRLAAFDAKEHGALAQAIDSAGEALEATVTRLGTPSDTPSWRDLARELSRELADAIRVPATEPRRD